ncbi:MAG: SDR family NAD(P)-dependent oxidoreductase, partial [Myxococcota bacterium]|nr:SDR family NAD(P)-dependent oxidoreductase [Myxococcota bacterium]
MLIHAATGGVGLTAVRYASSTGAEVYATAGRESKHEYLRSTMGIPAGRIGSSRDCVAFRQQMDAAFFNEEAEAASSDRQLDAVLNSLSHDEYIAESLRMVKDEGHFLEIGKRGIWSPAAMASARPRVLYHVIGVDSRMEEDPAWMGQVLADLGGRVERGDARVAPLPVEAFDMRTQCVGAFQHLQRAHHIGKVVVTIRPSLVWSMSSKGSCVVSGGTGALGLLVGQWLVDRGAGRVVLLSRRGGHSGGHANAKAWATLQAHQEADVAVRRCDVSDMTAVRSLMLDVHRDVAPIQGVVHAAGVLRDALLSDQTDDAFDVVWQPKAAGAMHLHNATIDDLKSDLDLFVMFSSQTALLGNPGQTNYGAANAVLDALAVRRRSMGLCGTSIQWGAWSESGMAVDSNVVGRMWSHGMRGISNAEGLDALDVCVAQGRPAVLGVVPVVSWGRLLGGGMSGGGGGGGGGGVDGSGVPAFLGGFEREARTSAAAGGSSAGGEGTTTEFVTSLVGRPAEEQLSLTQAMVIRTVCEVAMVEVGLDDALKEAGVDSLASTELQGQLQLRLGSAVALPNTLMFDYPTVGAMSEYIVSSVQASGMSSFGKVEDNATDVQAPPTSYSTLPTV